MKLQIVSEYKPTGDQPEAIKALSSGIIDNVPHQTLLGVTGSGKTFTVANVIEQVQKPTLILSHNKTLAAQLYQEMKQFFPNNLVEYFVSYYDYYQPEAYLPTSDLYIEKDLSINDELDKLRLSTTSALLSGRKDIIVVSSVSCLYGIGNPKDFKENMIEVFQGKQVTQMSFLRELVDALYTRDEVEFKPSKFRVKGDTVDIFPAYDTSFAIRVIFWGDEIQELRRFDPLTGYTIDKQERLVIYPANIFMTTKESLNRAIGDIQIDLGKQIDFFKEREQHLEAKRIEERVTYDIEMMKELGYCSGIENYSRYFDRRAPGTRPFCLLDYFPEDYLTVVDESHVTYPQIRAMYGGDHSRKTVLVDYGFRLPAAIDNRPLKFEEFEALSSQLISVSATPADYELNKSDGVIVEQIIRPTGLLDPPVEVRPSINQIDDLIEEIHATIANDERILVTTLTKRMAEELSEYLINLNIKTAYIHSDIDTLERIEILDQLREGNIDVLVGINLLREGLDLPQVSLVAIIDADKEGFLRSERSLIQTAGRAARNVRGKVIMYADKITASMQKMIDQTNYRRSKQMSYNEEHGITPTQIIKDKSTSILQRGKQYAQKENDLQMVADPALEYMSLTSMEKLAEETEKKMKKAAKELDFVEATRLRNELFDLRKKLKTLS